MYNEQHFQFTFEFGKINKLINLINIPNPDENFDQS